MRLFSKITALMIFALVALAPSAGLCAGPRIAVLPWKVNAAGDMGYVRNAMSDMLTSRLGAGQVEIVRHDQVSEAVSTKKGELNDASAFEAGKAVKSDFVLYGSITIFGNAVSLDARLIDIKTGEAAPFASKGTGLESIIGLADRLSVDIISFLNPKAGAPLAAQETSKAGAPAPVAAPVPAVPANEAGLIIKADKSKEQPVLWKGREMEGMYVAMTAADLDKDGKKELFLVSENTLTIARYGSSGMEVIKEIKGKRGQNIAVTSIDSDNDGATEVYVSRIVDDKTGSLLVEYKDGEYAVTASNLNWMLRAVSVEGKGPVLLGQRFRNIDGIHGDLKKLRKQGSTLIEEGPFDMELPKRVDIFNFESFRFTGADAPELVTLDSRQYLTLYGMKDKGWAQSYKSAEYYGGTLNRVKLREASAELGPVSIEGGFLPADFDKDGKKELIIKKNTPGGLGRSAEVPASFKTGEIISLSWDSKGGTTTENWRAKQVEGYISDFFIDDLDADGSQEITMMVVTGTEKMFGTIKSYVLSYRISL